MALGASVSTPVDYAAVAASRRAATVVVFPRCKQVMHTPVVGREHPVAHMRQTGGLVGRLSGNAPRCQGLPSHDPSDPPREGVVPPRLWRWR